MNNIHIKEGDITRAKVDAIVNAANPQMLGGGGVDGAIHRAAGADLIAQCRKVKAVNGVRCPFGEARITSAGNLRASYVIHTAGPIYQREKDPKAVLANAYRNSLNLAIRQNCKSIAFPAISCGVYGYPAVEAADIAIQVCAETKYQELNIYFYLYSASMVDIWQSALQANTP